MQHSTVFGRALSPTELSSTRYLDALIAFRPESCLRMEDTGGDVGSGDQGGDGGSGGNGGAGGDQGNKGGDGDKGESGKGFPDSTPVADMKPEEQAAYWKHQAQKHEGRNRDLLTITGGKHGDALKAELEELGTLRQEKLTPSEKAIEEAKQAARSEVLPQLAETAFRVAIGDRKTEAEVNEFIGDLNLSRFIKDGKVDTAKVLERVQQYAPAKDTGDGNQQQRDYGQGNRGGGGAAKSGVSAGRDLHASRHQKSSTNS